MRCGVLAREARPRQTPTEEKMKQRELERLDKAIYPTPARKRHFKRIACYALFGAAMAISATAP
jgi:hypothetical protein